MEARMGPGRWRKSLRRKSPVLHQLCSIKTTKAAAVQSESLFSPVALAALLSSCCESKSFMPEDRSAEGGRHRSATLLLGKG